MIRDPRELKESERYRLLKRLEFDDILDFVLENVRKRNPVTFLFYLVNILFLAAIIAWFIWSRWQLDSTWKSLILQGVAGLFSGSFLIIPFHEALHALAYKMMGAPRIYFGKDMRQLLFYVAVDRYVINQRELTMLALTPFIGINALMVVVTLLFFPQILTFTLFLLLSHNVMCIGDFAMTGFAWEYRRKRIVTYDEMDSKTSYFYILEESEDS